MLKHSCLAVAMLVVLATSARGQSPAFVQPQAGEYTVTRFELATPSIDTIQGASVSRKFIDLTGILLLLGRRFIDGDFEVNAGPVAIISYDLWKRRFNGDSAIIGKSIRLNGHNIIVVGVTPAEFDFPKRTAVWVPRH
jgi:hypothetical protein